MFKVPQRLVLQQGVLTVLRHNHNPNAWMRIAGSWQRSHATLVTQLHGWQRQQCCIAGTELCRHRGTQGCRCFVISVLCHNRVPRSHRASTLPLGLHDNTAQPGLAPQECQKAAWPQHKRGCTSSPRAGSNAGSTTTSPRSAQAGGGDSNSSKAPGSVLDALKQVLQQHSSVPADDPLQQQFEQAVLLFVSGEHRAAAAALQGVQAAAEAQGKKAVAGEGVVGGGAGDSHLTCDAAGQQRDWSVTCPQEAFQGGLQAL